MIYEATRGGKEIIVVRGTWKSQCLFILDVAVAIGMSRLGGLKAVMPFTTVRT